MAVKLSDIAASVGVSAATVSLVLNGKPGVSESMRSTVLETADRLGYRPNHAGRSLRLSRVGAIGIYAPETMLDYSLYYSEVTRGVVLGLTESGYSPVLLPSLSKTGDLRDLPTVDGYLLIEPHSDDLGVKAILASDEPTVCIDAPHPSAGKPWGIVEPNTTISAAEAFNHLLQHGSKRPGLLTVEKVSQWTADVTAAYATWCESNKIEPVIIHIDAAESNEALLHQLADAIGLNENGCDALYICSDSLAPRIAGLLRSLGISVGEQFGLVSGVDSAMMEYHTPPITSVDMSPQVFGQKAARMVLELLRLPARPDILMHEVVPAPLVKRST